MADKKGSTSAKHAVLVCWECNREYELNSVPFRPTETNQLELCSCGGTIVSNSGKVKMRIKDKE